MLQAARRSHQGVQYCGARAGASIFETPESRSGCLTYVYTSPAANPMKAETRYLDERFRRAAFRRVTGSDKAHSWVGLRSTSKSRQVGASRTASPSLLGSKGTPYDGAKVLGYLVTHV